MSAETSRYIDRQLIKIAETQERIDAQIAALTQSTQVLTNDIECHDNALGDLLLEAHYYQRAPAYVGRLVRRAQVLSAAELVDLLENAVEQGILTEEEKEEMLLTDVVMRGKRKDDGAPVYLAIEVSWGVGPYDVERAAHRAALLSKLGVPAMPVVAGRSITTHADELARQKQVQRIIRNE